MCETCQWVSWGQLWAKRDAIVPHQRARGPAALSLQMDNHPHIVQTFFFLSRVFKSTPSHTTDTIHFQQKFQPEPARRKATSLRVGWRVSWCLEGVHLKTHAPACKLGVLLSSADAEQDEAGRFWVGPQTQEGEEFIHNGRSNKFLYHITHKPGDGISTGKGSKPGIPAIKSLE